MWRHIWNHSKMHLHLILMVFLDSVTVMACAIMFATVEYVLNRLDIGVHDEETVQVLLRLSHKALIFAFSFFILMDIIRTVKKCFVEIQEDLHKTKGLQNKVGRADQEKESQ